VLGDGLRADSVPPLALGTLHLLFGGKLDFYAGRDFLMASHSITPIEADTPTN
jgi:hypothetical protein